MCENCDITEKPLQPNFHHNCVKALKEKVKILSCEQINKEKDEIL